MRISILLLAPLLLAAAPATQPTAFPTTRPGHDREPWVFRCVLDGNARSVVVSLGQNRWVAYDAATCSLTKFWVGDIELTGPVYDYKHGPQPRAKGALLLDRKAAISQPGSIITGLDTLGREQAKEGRVGAATQQAPNVADLFRFRYRGYSIKDDAVTFHYEREATRVDETPGVRVNADGMTTIIRTITSTSGGVGVALPTSDSVRSIKLVEGSVVLMDGKVGNVIVAPADISFSAKTNRNIVLSDTRPVVIETEFSVPKN